MTACAHRDCPNAGTHHPVILAMPADRPDYAGPPAELILGMVVCPAHQMGVTASDFVTDEGWTQIVHAFGLGHRALPDRATLGLAWKRPDFVRDAFEPAHTNAIAGEVQRDDALRPRRGVR